MTLVYTLHSFVKGRSAHCLPSICQMPLVKHAGKRVGKRGIPGLRRVGNGEKRTVPRVPASDEPLDTAGTARAATGGAKIARRARQGVGTGGAKSAGTRGAKNAAERHVPSKPKGSAKGAKSAAEQEVPRVPKRGAKGAKSAAELEVPRVTTGSAAKKRPASPATRRADHATLPKVKREAMRRAKQGALIVTQSEPDASSDGDVEEDEEEKEEEEE